MSSELFFIYDSHCPWSYAATPLVKNIINAFPDMRLRLMHNAYYDGENHVNLSSINAVKDLSKVNFGQNYLDSLTDSKDSTLAANLLTWVQHKSNKHALSLLIAMQKAHFEEGNPLTDKDEVQYLIDELKLSPPAKALKIEKLTKDAEFAFHDITELQEVIGTNAIPALLIAHNEKLILLNHNLYLENPDKIVEAVEAELV
ncbi:MAG: hypothetical protein KC484_08715 [Colwelliaceae bacterium]|nr:hypothetical protein [Colwelliaceae bacterium]